MYSISPTSRRSSITKEEVLEDIKRKGTNMSSHSDLDNEIDEDGNVIGFDPPNPEYVDSTVYSWPIDYTVNVECDIKNYGDD